MQKKQRRKGRGTEGDGGGVRGENGGIEIKKQNRAGGAGNSASVFLLPRPTRGTSPDVPFKARLLVVRMSSPILRRPVPPSNLCFASRRYTPRPKKLRILQR